MDLEIKKIQEQIGKNVKKLRLEKNYTQLELAKKLKITTVAVSQLERGKTSFSLSKIIQLCKVLETNIYYIFKDTDVNIDIGTYQTKFEKIHKQLEILEKQDFQLIQLILNSFERRYINAKKSIYDNEDLIHSGDEYINSKK